MTIDLTETTTGAIHDALRQARLRLGGAASGMLRPEAVVRAASMDDAVALSPGCASYDMYRDFEERGDDFARAVERLGRNG